MGGQWWESFSRFTGSGQILEMNRSTGLRRLLCEEVTLGGTLLKLTVAPSFPGHGKMRLDCCEKEAWIYDG